jgi:predicted flap endonuclease-1-like 5' DNA nuclease
MSFHPSDRKLLLAAKGVGPTVISRLEQLGFSSLEQLASADAATIVENAAALVGSTCWKNSPQARAAIEAAIAVAAQSAKTAPANKPAPSSSPSTVSLVEELRQLANLGPKSAQALAEAGVCSVEHLRQLGSVGAYVLAKKSGANVSLNLLWALEGALSNQPWQIVAREHRTSLLLALEAAQSGG